MGAAMAADVVVSRELKSLQDELAIAQRERLAAPTAPPITPPQERADQLRSRVAEAAEHGTPWDLLKAQTERDFKDR
jgi:hypothetical protein